jgi:RimJ/RimL family protein N-acetyltransferase
MTLRVECTLTTERLYLRPFRLDDAEAAHRLLDTHSDVWQFDPGETRTLEERTDILRYRIAEFNHHGFGLWAVVEQASGALVGYCGLQLYLLEDEPRSSVECELYYKLGRDYWGRGYATEACRAVIGVAFGRLRLPRLVTCTDKDNVRSVALLRRLGMRVTEHPDHPGEVLGVLDNPAESGAAADGGA